MDTAYAFTRGMTDEEIDESLRTTGTGVLSLADGDTAYGIPLAHYYDGEDLYFRVGYAPDSTKRRYMETTETASYTVYGTEETADPQGLDSWSVVVTGTLADLPEAEHDRFDTAEINRQFAPIRLFGEDVDEVDITILALRVETITGRCTPSGQNA